jgi:anti-anti-sigma factor
VLDVAIRHDSTHAYLHPHGDLDVSTYRSLRDALIKCATDEPPAIVVGIDDLRVASPALLSVFYSAWIQISQWPDIPIVLVAVEDQQRQLLAATAIPRFIAVFDSEPDAVASLHMPPTRRRATVVLPPLPASSGHARRFVREQTSCWHVPEMATPANAIVTELVENTLVHTRSEARVRMELRRGLLSVAVSDDDPHPAMLPEGPTGLRKPSGLAIVAATARAWGCYPTTPGGKIVWATLRVS